MRSLIRNVTICCGPKYVSTFEVAVLRRCQKPVGRDKRELKSDR